MPAALDVYAKIHTLVHAYAHTEAWGENTKRRVWVYRISEFAVYLGAFAVARGKTQASAVVRQEGERWKNGNRRSGFAPVVSEGSERRRTWQIAEKWKKGLLALVGESPLKRYCGRS